MGLSRQTVSTIPRGISGTAHREPKGYLGDKCLHKCFTLFPLDCPSWAPLTVCSSSSSLYLYLHVHIATYVQTKERKGVHTLHKKEGPGKSRCEGGREGGRKKRRGT